MGLLTRHVQLRIPLPVSSVSVIDQARSPGQLSGPTTLGRPQVPLPRRTPEAPVPFLCPCVACARIAHIARRRPHRSSVPAGPPQARSARPWRRPLPLSPARPGQAGHGRRSPTNATPEPNPARRTAGSLVRLFTPSRASVCRGVSLLLLLLLPLLLLPWTWTRRRRPPRPLHGALALRRRRPPTGSPPKILQAACDAGRPTRHTTPSRHTAFSTFQHFFLASHSPAAPSCTATATRSALPVSFLLAGPCFIIGRGVALRSALTGGIWETGKGFRDGMGWEREQWAFSRGVFRDGIGRLSPRCSFLRGHWR